MAKKSSRSAIPRAALRAVKMPLYDTMEFREIPSEGIPFFAIPIGGAMPVSANVKSESHTNMLHSGQLWDPLEFDLHSIGVTIEGIEFGQGRLADVARFASEYVRSEESLRPDILELVSRAIDLSGCSIRFYHGGQSPLFESPLFPPIYDRDCSDMFDVMEGIVANVAEKRLSGRGISEICSAVDLLGADVLNGGASIGRLPVKIRSREQFGLRLDTCRPMAGDDIITMKTFLSGILYTP